MKTLRILVVINQADANHTYIFYKITKGSKLKIIKVKHYFDINDHHSHF